MIIKELKSTWAEVVRDRIEYPSIRDKLRVVKFNKSGNMRPGKGKVYAEKHFPNLIKLFNQTVFDKEKDKKSRVSIGPKVKQAKISSQGQISLF